MTREARRRFVDAHVHLWDQNANPWYRFPEPGDDRGFGLTKPFPDRYLWEDHLQAVASVRLDKWVHVSAVTDVGDVEAESAWVGAIAEEIGLPHAIIGSVNSAWPLARIEAALDREMANPAYRGLRLLGGADYDSAHTDRLLTLLSSRGLVYDAVANTGAIANAARGLAKHPDLTIVLEHTGWPLAHDYEHFALWRAEMAEFACLPNAFCKLSGLGMVVHRNDPTIFRRFFDECIALFGPERCMFASNFPVDLSYGSGEELLSLFEQVGSACSIEEAEQLFAGAAESAYRL